MNTPVPVGRPSGLVRPTSVRAPGQLQAQQRSVGSATTSKLEAPISILATGASSGSSSSSNGTIIRRPQQPSCAISASRLPTSTSAAAAAATCASHQARLQGRAATAAASQQHHQPSATLVRPVCTSGQRALKPAAHPTGQLGANEAEGQARGWMRQTLAGAERDSAESLEATSGLDLASMRSDLSSIRQMLEMLLLELQASGSRDQEEEEKEERQMEDGGTKEAAASKEIERLQAELAELRGRLPEQRQWSPSQARKVDLIASSGDNNYCQHASAPLEPRRAAWSVEEEAEEEEEQEEMEQPQQPRRTRTFITVERRAALENSSELEARGEEEEKEEREERQTAGRAPQEHRQAAAAAAGHDKSPQPQPPRESVYFSPML